MGFLKGLQKYDNLGINKVLGRLFFFLRKKSGDDGLFIFTDPKWVWEKINPYRHSHVLRTNALGSRRNPKALCFEYKKTGFFIFKKSPYLCGALKKRY
jgi:hypothetical protein